MGSFRKALALAMVLSIILSVALAIEWDPGVQDQLNKVEAWSDYYNKWHDVPAFGPDGRWNVERSFDHEAHWQWQLQEMERLYGKHPSRVPKSGAGSTVGKGSGNEQGGSISPLVGLPHGTDHDEAATLQSPLESGRR